jgi:peptidoglycan pentaglycine glycine transferase (the first glycine)
MPVIERDEWRKTLENLPNAHILQTPEWGDLKAAFGWQVHHVLLEGYLGAQILFRPLPIGLSIAYIPKGPVWLNPSDPAPLKTDRFFQDDEHWKHFLNDVCVLCKRKRSIFLKIEPDIALRSGDKFPAPPHFHVSDKSIQPQQTLFIHLHGDEDILLSRMKQKTRYNIRLAEKKGVIVHNSNDIETFYDMYQETAIRDSYHVHCMEYYQKAYDLFHPRGECELLFAEHDGEKLASVMLFKRGNRAWYFYGASVNHKRAYMPAYLLQWHAIRWAQANQCDVYDLWGVPDVSESELEKSFTQRSDGLWGVYRFKRGFGGEIIRSPGPWDKPLIPAFYQLYLKMARGGRTDG